jgi:hypothetical protein
LKLRVIAVFAIGCVTALAEAPPVRPEIILANYCVASAGQAQALGGASMEVEIDASLPGLKKTGRLHALRHISRLGRITYEKLFFEGDGTIKNQVIARYLTAEAEAQNNPPPSLAVTPENYKFKYRGMRVLDGRDTHVFDVSPRKKKSGLYKGQIWIDAATYFRVREAGYLVKTPSIFLKKIAFVRKYAIRDGILIPLQVQSEIDTRLVGKAELTVDYRNVSMDDTDPNERVASGGQGVGQ